MHTFKHKTFINELLLMQFYLFNIRPKLHHRKLQQGNHAIAKMTARCTQYMSALKIVGLCKPHYNLITIQWGGEIIFEAFHPM